MSTWTSNGPNYKIERRPVLDVKVGDLVRVLCTDYGHPNKGDIGEIIEVNEMLTTDWNDQIQKQTVDIKFIDQDGNPVVKVGWFMWKIHFEIYKVSTPIAEITAEERANAVSLDYGLLDQL